jgi:glycosyltransferase involved in cell wall biosynthesis
MFPSWFPSKENRLSAIFTKKHIDIIALKNKVTVVYAEKSNNIIGNKYEIEIDNSNKYSIYICYYKPNESKVKLVRRIFNFYFRINAFLRAINSTNIHLKSFDFIHIHVISFECIIPLYYKVFKRKPYFVSEHATAYLREVSLYSLNNIFKKIILKNSSGISAVSNSLKNAIRKLEMKTSNFPVITNYVDENKFHYQTKLANKNIKFLHVSRLEEKAKNVIGIINAFDEIYKNNNHIELHIVGGFINQISDAERYINNQKSKSNIFFHGVKLGDQILKYYQECDILVMFSNYETQGVVVMEALFCGLPVLVTNLPCLKEYLHDKNSILVNPNDEKRLKENMQMFIDQKWNIWDSEKIARDIRNKFSLNTIETSFTTFYQRGFKVLK